MGLTKFTEKLISDGFKASISGSDIAESSSFASRVTLVEGGTTSKTLVSGSAQLAADISGSFGNQRVGTSDSPTFAGGTVTGDFSVGGTITAQEVHTEFESASILFTSGSTKFGNSGDDIHNMTGSIRVSGSAVNDSFFLGHNIGIGITSPTTYYEKVLHIHESAGSSAIHLTNNTTGTTRDDGTDLIEYQDDFYIWSRESAGNILIGTNATERLRISGSGEAIFSSDVKAAKFEVYTTSTTDPVLILGDQGVADYKFTFPDTGTMKLSTSTSSSKKFFLKNDGSGQFNFETDGEITLLSYLNIDQAAQNGIRIKTDDTAVIWVYDKSSDAITGGVNWGHSDGTTIFYTGGTNERMRIESGGDIKMTELLYVNNAVNHGRTTAGSTFRAANNGNAAITLLSSANHSAGVGQDIVSLNFAANNEWSTTKDGVYAQIRCENGNGSYADRGQLVFATGYNGNTIYDRMTLSYDGILGFDTGVPASATGATKGIHINTGGVPFIRYTESNSSGGTADYEIYVANGVYVLYDNDDSAGVYSVSTSQVISGDFNDTSDVGLKENIKTIDSGLSVVNKLNPVTFDWKNKKKGSNSGFIAQEVEKLLPNDVEGEDFNTDYPSGRVGDVTEDEDKGFNNFGKSINLGGIVAHLTKAVQELSEENDSLKSRIETLEN